MGYSAYKVKMYDKNSIKDRITIEDILFEGSYATCEVVYYMKIDYY